MPFLVSVLLVLLNLPLLHWLRRHRLPSRLAALITLATMVSVVAGVVAVVEGSASRYLLQLPSQAARVAGMEAELTHRGVDWLEGLGVPLHPGAARYYRERGLIDEASASGG